MHEVLSHFVYLMTDLFGACAHRALADAEMAAGVLARLEHELRRRYRVPAVTHALLRELQAASGGPLEAIFARLSGGRG